MKPVLRTQGTLASPCGIVADLMSSQAAASIPQHGSAAVFAGALPRAASSLAGQLDRGKAFALFAADAGEGLRRSPGERADVVLAWRPGSGWGGRGPAWRRGARGLDPLLS